MQHSTSEQRQDEHLLEHRVVRKRFNIEAQRIRGRLQDIRFLDDVFAASLILGHTLFNMTPRHFYGYVMPRVFISYRRDDTKKDAGRIYDHLTLQLGRDNVFKDVDAIPVGTDFRDVLKHSIEQCDVMLVLIGAKWLEVDASSGYRRIDNVDDFVRFEVIYGLSLAHIKVIPVLVENATMPSVDILPAPIQPLVYLNAAVVRDDPDFTRDIGRLLSELKGIPTYLRDPSQSKKQPCWISFVRFVGISMVIVGLIIGLLIVGIAVANRFYGVSPRADTSPLTPVPSPIPEIVDNTATAIVLPTASPTQLATVIASRPTSHDEARSMTSIWSIIDFNDVQSPASQIYNVNLPVDTYVINFSWCADSVSQLAEITQPLSVSFFLNGVELNESQVLETDVVACRVWDTVLSGIQADVSTFFEIRYFLRQQIFDGNASYAPGEYIHSILIFGTAQ